MAWPAAAFAHDPTRVYRIFWVSTQSQPDPFLDGFREGLRARGYVEGKNIALELYYAPGNPQALREVVSERQARQRRPCCVERPCDPRDDGGHGYSRPVCPERRPGGARHRQEPRRARRQLHRLDLPFARSGGKRVELLKEIFPTLRTLAVLSNSLHPGEQSEWHATQEAARQLGIALIYVPFAGAHELDSALGLVGDARPDGLLVFPDVLTMVHRAKIAQLAIKHRLPSMFGWSEYCDAGGLISYGANQRATYFGLAAYADRILRGESPATLPVVQPTKFELAVNLRTAEQLGIDLDKSSILFRANKVIE